MENFGLKPHQIANSRDLSFEEHILRQTNGRGVDIVLNSLSETKLKASVHCLAEGGRFVEIGKYDIIVNNALGTEYKYTYLPELKLSLLTDMSEFGSNKSFQATCLAHLDVDAFINKSSSALMMRKRIYKLICDGIESGEVQPLKRHVFEREHVEDAFRFMASGKHIGKVVIKIRGEQGANVSNSAKPSKLTAIR